MARKLRLEYAGAIYHVMNRCDRPTSELDTPTISTFDANKDRR